MVIISRLAKHVGKLVNLYTYLNLTFQNTSSNFCLTKQINPNLNLDSTSATAGCPSIDRESPHT